MPPDVETRIKANSRRLPLWGSTLAVFASDDSAVLKVVNSLGNGGRDERASPAALGKVVVGTPEAIVSTWSGHREIIMDQGPLPPSWSTPASA